MGIFKNIKKLFSTEKKVEKQKVVSAEKEARKKEQDLAVKPEIVEEKEKIEQKVVEEKEQEETPEKEIEEICEEEVIPEKEIEQEQGETVTEEVEKIELEQEQKEISEEVPVEITKEIQKDIDDDNETQDVAEQEETEEEDSTSIIEQEVEQKEEKIVAEDKSPIEPKKEESTQQTTEKEKLEAGLQKTKNSFFGKLARTVAGKSTIDELALDDIEETLITSDIGVETSLKIIEKLEERVARDKYINTSELNQFLKDEISVLMKDSYVKIPKVEGPYVIMIVGVNGVGKTTTIGKLAHKFKQEGKKVVLGAADTFRAAAVDQLTIWAERIGVDIVKQDMGSDPASVCFDTIQSAKANNADVVIIDTAGRLHNNVNLMKELGKIRNVMAKVIPEAPHDVMLILDASTGQNAIEQATQFTAATDVDSITLTKLDGTAKGGVVIGISDQFQIPVRYIGVGEGSDDLQEFNKEDFVNSLFN